MDIPTIEEYLSFEYQGQFGTVTEHALRVSVCPHMAYRRYMAGLPLEDVYRDIDDYDIANLERMAAQGMTADSISAVTEFTPETVAAVTGAKRADYVNKKERRAAARKLLRNNPHHTAASLAVYIRRYTDAFIEKDRAVTSCQTEMHDPLNDVDGADSWKDRAEEAEAKLAELAQQEPVAFWWVDQNGKTHGGPHRGSPSDAAVDNARNSGCEAQLLYARPVPAVPDIIIDDQAAYQFLTLTMRKESSNEFQNKLRKLLDKAVTSPDSSEKQA